MPSLYQRISTAAICGATLVCVAPVSAGGFDWLHKKNSSDCDEVIVEACDEPVCESPVCATPICESPVCETIVQPQGYCGDGSCESADGQKSGCFKKIHWHSDEWYAERAHLPPGERQRLKHGKLTPVEPRPDLPPQPYWHLYHSVKNWPHPYDCVDRESIASTYATMARRGWMNTTTLHEFHFDDEFQTLNSSGISKLRYVLHNVPAEYRAVYVNDVDRRLTPMRVANVRASLVELSGQANSLPVVARYADNPSRPAMEVEQINRQRLDGMLPPVITYDQADTGE